MWSKGICWIDDCRIPFVDDKDIPNDMDKTHLTSDRMFLEREGYKPFLYEQNTEGRFPANILVSDDMLNDGNVGQNNSKNQEWKLQYKSESHIYGKYKGAGISRIADKGTNSRYYDIDKWFEKILNYE